LLSCNTISGYVYHDANADGLMDAGDSPIAGSPLQLVNGAGQVVGTAVSGADGSYLFSIDQTVGTGDVTVQHQATLPEQTTNWTRNLSIPRFDPSLGTLTEVEIINEGDLTAQIQVESKDSTPQTVTGTVSGTLTLSGPGVSSLVTSTSHSETFSAAAYDGTPDYGGKSGHDFGPQTASGSKTITLTAASLLAQYTGSGSVTFTEKATGTSSATSTGGNLQDLIQEQGEGAVTVIYHYLPNNCLQPGSYTIVQTSDPPGYVDGWETRGNITPIPGSATTDFIAVTLANTNLTNNNFGELLPASVAGHVYYDVNDNGIRDKTDPPIPGTTVILTGSNDLGQMVNLSMATLSDGTYSFSGLRPGHYAITELQPSPYQQGTNNLGSLGGTLGADQFFIALGEGQNGVNYDFGEVLQGSNTNGRPPIHRTPLSKNLFISDGSTFTPRHTRAAHHRPIRHRHRHF
jgi:hypothetical protein